MHHKYGGISESHACKDCVWPIILDAELYTTCPGERMLIVMTHQKKKLQLTVQVCCLFYFLLHSRFFKGNVNCGIFNGFIVAFLKTGVFLVGSNYINTEDNHGRLIDFLSQI